MYDFKREKEEKLFIIKSQNKHVKSKEIPF
ncbi:unknown [Prevotella sp. CAG:755]|nr:unknown [Prevotella sp. CAG:755]